MAAEVALVTGGCGCVGFHVVKALLNYPMFSSLHVFSRNPTINQQSGVGYHVGDLTSDTDVAFAFSDQ